MNRLDKLSIGVAVFLSVLAYLGAFGCDAAYQPIPPAPADCPEDEAEASGDFELWARNH